MDQATRSTNADDYQHVPRPIAAMPKEFADGHVIAPHAHARAQLLYAASGTMRVIAQEATSHATWMVPTLRALWIPAAVTHEIRMCGPVSMRTLYIEPEAAPWADDRCAVIEVSGLLRELILEAMRQPVEYDTAGRAGLVRSEEHTSELQSRGLI